MAGLTQEQHSNNRFTLESILEEEDDGQESVVEKGKKSIKTTKQANLSRSINALRQTVRLMN